MGLGSSNDWPSFKSGILLVLAVLLANGLISYRALSDLVNNNQRVVHTLHVINELDATLSVMKDAENGQRGYLITRDISYLDGYNRAASEVTPHVEVVSVLTKDNAYQQSRIPTLRHLIQERLAIAENILELEQSGRHQEARRLISSNLGRQKMEEIRQLVSDMRDHEDLLLEARSQASKRGVQQAGVTFTLASLLAVLFVLAFFQEARREVWQKARAADALREREAWLHTTLHSIGDAVIATNEKGEVKFINGVAARLLRRESADVEGKPLAQVFPIFNEITGAPAVNPVANVIQKGASSALSNHTMLQNQQGERIPIEDSAAPILDKDGRVTGAVLVFRDVSHQRRVQEIARTSEKLAATGRLAATIAHEINNPLEAAINLLYLAQGSASMAEIKRYIADADHELSRMAHITQKTLTFSRSSSGATSTNLRHLLGEVTGIYDGRIKSQRIKVEIDCPPNLAITTIKGDLQQIVSNLVANALDALEPGGRLKIKASAEPGGAKVEIEDNGSGIPTQNLDRIFEPFFTTKKDTGTGLGLWVVRDLVDKQGGTISVVSSTDDVHRGTRFSLFLPSLQPEAVRMKAS